MILYEHTIPIVFLVMALLAAIALGAFSFWRFLPRNRYTWLLAGLYLLALAVLAWCMLMPGRKDAVTRLLKPRFVVALDTSSSMTLTPAEESPSRWEEALRALEMPWTSLVGSECDIDVIAFSDLVGDKMTVAQAKALSPEGQSSRIRDGLKQIADRYTGLNVAGAVLLSDGHDTREAFDDWATDAFSFPLDTVRLQSDEGWQAEADLRIDDVHTPRRVTVDWKTELKVQVSGQGTQGQAVPVKVFKDGTLLTEKPVQIPAEGGEREVVFELEHPEVGVYKYSVHVPPFPSETNKEDNRFELSVQVTDARNRLLYVEGAPRWEYKFLKRTLVANKKVTPLIFYGGHDGKPRAGTQVGTMTAEMTESQLAFFKVVVLGNLDATSLSSTQVANLTEFVEDGGSLVFLGGTKAWGDGGMLSTDLSKILPVRSGGMEVLEAKKPFPVALTDAAAAHPAFAGDPELWETIPPVLSIFQGVEPLPAAQVLVEANTAGGMQPVVVSHRYGQGKVAAIFTDSLWRWQLSPEGAATKPYSRFWGQLISWMLPKEDDLEEGRVDLSADRDRLFLGEVVELSSRVADESEQGIMRSIVTLPDGSDVPLAMNPRQTTTASGQSSEGYGLSFTAEQSGLHKVMATWTSGGQTRKSDPISFFVKAFSPEKVPQPINQTVLKAIASGSGGRYFTSLDELDEALSGLTMEAVEEQTAEFHTLWRNPVTISILMILLSASWVVRKTRNMP